MAQLDTLETKLDELLHKKAPVQLPPNVRGWIARNIWWLSVLGGLSLLWSSVVLWQFGHAVDRAVDIYGYPTSPVYLHHLGLFYYLALLSMAGTGVLLLIAAANLKDMRRTGWLYLFYAQLLQAATAIFQLFTGYDAGGGFGHFLGTLIGLVVSTYVLFQIRDRFTLAGAAASHSVDDTPVHKTDSDAADAPKHPADHKTAGHKAGKETKE